LHHPASGAAETPATTAAPEAPRLDRVVASHSVDAFSG